MPGNEHIEPERKKPNEVAQTATPQRHGPGGYCVCVQCGQEAPHASGRTCQEQPCPTCGAAMVDNDATAE